MADELVLDFKDAPGLPAHAASEGTLIVLGILCAMFSPSHPNLILLDDIDRALHPKAQHDLVAGIRTALAAAPNLQIVATTHSPYLVDALQPEEVVVLARRQDGAVAAKRLSEHPKARMLDVLTTGEFWTAEGEDWVAQP
jgi:predicted ATPase